MCRARRLYTYKIYMYTYTGTEKHTRTRMRVRTYRAHSHAARSLMHRQNKFAYACDRVRTELRDGKWVDGSLMEPARQEREWNTSALLLESNVAGGQGLCQWSLRDFVTGEAADRIVALKK